MEKKNEPSTEGTLDFEHMLRQYFGDKADGLQGLRTNMTAMRRELRKVVNKIESKIIGLETTTRHQKRLLNEIEKLKEDLSQKNIDPWTLVIHLLSLVSRLLGYDYLRGFVVNTPLYFQTPNQYYTQVIFENNDVKQRYDDDSLNLIILQKEMYQGLKKRAFSDFKIAQIMNTTEYQIKKLKRNL